MPRSGASRELHRRVPAPDGRCKIAGTDDNGREVVVILNPFDALDIGKALIDNGVRGLSVGAHLDTRAPRDEQRGQEAVS